MRQHLITHHEWWNDEENANALDELRMMGIFYNSERNRWTDWPEGGEKLKPPTRSAASARPQRLTARSGRAISHLDCYEDPPAEENTLSARGARTRSPVWRQLHNCAGGYIDRVKRGYVLVAAFEGEADRSSRVGSPTRAPVGSPTGRG